MHAPRLGLLALLPCLAVVPPSRLGAEPVAPAEPTGSDITLPLYEIAETRERPKRERWTHGQVAGLEVLSCGTDSQTRKLVEELQRFRIALGAVWPQALRHAGPPVTLILCGRGDTFDAFAPYNPDDRRSNSTAASRFLADKERAFLVVDLTRRTVQLVDDKDFQRTGDAVGTDDITIDHYQELTRAYIRYLVRRPTPPPPPWLAEGLTQLISAVKYDRRSITFGELEPGPNAQEGLQATSRPPGLEDLGTTPRGGQIELVNADPDALPGPAGVTRRGNSRDFSGVRGGMTMMPMDQFFAVREDSPAANLTLGTNWADQAHAFVHLCIYGENHRFQKPFFTFISRLQNEPLTEALFIECFKMDYKKFAGFLRRYSASAWHTAERFELERGKLPDPEPLALTEAPVAVEARIRGDALLIARGEDTAFRTLVEPYRDGERDPELLASLGIVEARLGHASQAERLLESATRHGVDRPRAYSELARLRLAQFRAASGPADAPASPLSKAQLAQVLRPLFAARQIKPAVPDTYVLIAEAWEQSGTPPTMDNLAVLLEGAALFPSDSATLLRAAQLHQKIGALREAGALADLGATWATDGTMKARLLALKASLPKEVQVDLTRPAAQPAGGKADGDSRKPR